MQTNAMTAQAQDLLHEIVAVDAELSFVEAMLRMHLRRAEGAGDWHTVERIQRLMAS